MTSATTTVTSDRVLHIGMVAPPWFELPPTGYGGIEALVADLIDQLVGRGHRVTLVGSGRHRTRADNFVQVFQTPPSDKLGTLTWPALEVIHTAATAEALADTDVDIVHDHTLAGPLLARGRRVPTVATMHGPSIGEMGEYFRRLGDTVDVVSISDSQRRLNPQVNWVARVHNAINVASFPYQAHKDDYVLWIGRFCADKGPDLAIDAARAAGRRIVLAGKCREPEEKAYFAKHVKPRLGPDAEYVGEAGADQKRALMAGARSLVFPLQWEEPFGLVMIEAMACGTPVVALRRGSVPEIVRHGVSGLVVDDYRNFPAALHAAEGLDPADCRRHVTAHFDLPVMAMGYERVYRSLVEGNPFVHALAPARAEGGEVAQA